MTSAHVVDDATATPRATVDMKLEVVTIPVSDSDRAEQFYRSLGWRQDVTRRAPGSTSSRRPDPAARSSSAPIAPLRHLDRPRTSS